MRKQYLVIDTHADEYGAEECYPSTMTVGELISLLENYPCDMKVVVGNNIQSYKNNDWYTYGYINADRVINVVEEIEEEDEEFDTRFPKRISLNNGHSFHTVQEVMDKVNSPDDPLSWENIVNAMDDYTREEVHMDYAPCTHEEFLTHYLEIAPWDLILR